MVNRTRQAGFTLVEILIVVVILGILAAIVIPQFTSASESAKASSLTSQLQTIRSQLQLYQIQHNGSYPTIADLQANDNAWDPMVQPHTYDGTTNTYPTDPADANLGPYLQQPPKNAFTNSTSVVATAEADAGWEYDETTGQVKAVLPAGADPAELGLSESDYVHLGGGG
ncbi:MAG: type II secretion system protein [Phycisphaeraceae bacterium]